MFNSLSIATKLWLMSLVGSLFLISAAVLGYFALNKVSHAAWRMGQGKDVVADILPPPLYLVESQLIVKTLLHENNSNRSQLLDRLKQLKYDYDQRNQYWEVSEDITPQVKQSLLGEQRKHADAWWRELSEQFLPAIDAADREAAYKSMERLDSYYAQHRAGVDKTVALSTEFADDTLQQLGIVGNKATWFLVGAAMLGAFITLIMAHLVIRQIHNNIQIAKKATQNIANGDLTIQIPPSSQDEIGQLLLKISEMRDNLHELISDIRNQVTQLMRRSAELRDAAKNGAVLANNQSDAACNIAVSIEELSVSLDLVDSNAGQARKIAVESAEHAQSSAHVIEATADEMQKISEVVLKAANNISNLETISSEITSIVNVIHDVADQTNLLALNAAIEAARAGAHGRGFAVVADEVRKLAERTSASSVEIKLMVGKILEASRKSVVSMETGVEGVASGVALSQDAGQSVKGIQQAQSQVTISVDEISNAIREQSAATRDITKRVEMVTQGADSLATNADHTKESANELALQAEYLEKLTSRFRL